MGSTLRLEGITNIRDLGGLRTSDGDRVRSNRILRSASLHEMTDNDRATLKAHGVTTVIDLRASFERSEQPSDWPGVAFVSAPLVHDDQVRAIVEGFRAGTLTEDQLRDWWHLTGVFDAPHEHLPAVQRIFETLLTLEPSEAVVYHCRGGKDRTGMVTALILEGLGVTRADILSDFLESNSVLEAEAPTEDMAAIVSATLSTTVSPEAAFSFAGVREEWLDRLYGGVEDRYGSVHRYLTEAVGLGDDGIGRLRMAYLEPATG